MLNIHFEHDGNCHKLGQFWDMNLETQKRPSVVFARWEIPQGGMMVGFDEAAAFTEDHSKLIS